MTLEGYREFAKGGGRMRMVPADMGPKAYPFPVAIIQYEYARYPDWAARPHQPNEWLGFTFFAKPDLSDRIVEDSFNLVYLGREHRVLLYRGQPHIFEIQSPPYLLARYQPWPHWECWLIRKEIQAQP